MIAATCLILLHSRELLDRIKLLGWVWKQWAEEREKLSALCSTRSQKRDWKEKRQEVLNLREWLSLRNLRTSNGPQWVSIDDSPVTESSHGVVSSTTGFGLLAPEKAFFDENFYKQVRERPRIAGEIACVTTTITMRFGRARGKMIIRSQITLWLNCLLYYFLFTTGAPSVTRFIEYFVRRAASWSATNLNSGGTSLKSIWGKLP